MTATIELTKSQDLALTAITEFINGSRKDKYFVLTGYAGTGKSFLIKQIVKYLKENGISYICASPTNKASKNLKSMGIDEVTTVAKLLNQVPQLNEEEGKEVFVTKDNNNVTANQIDIADYRVVLIDEYSMINKDTFEQIQYKLLLAPRTKIIFVGDSAQLPPVKEDLPAVQVAMEKYGYPSANLSEVMRYDGEIAKVAEAIRTEPKYDRQFYPFNEVTDGTIEVLSPMDWCYKAIDMFQQGQELNNLDYCRIIAYTNKTCDKANQIIRGNLFPDADLPFVKGDKLITRKPLMRLNPLSKSRDDQWMVAIQTSEELEVINDCSIEPYNIPFTTESVNVYKFKVLTEDYLQITCNVPTEESQKLIEKKLAEYKKAKNWYMFYNLLKSFDNVTYPYALTCHKAQGSGYEFIFIDALDMKKCEFKQKMMYTALTRAKKQAFIRMG
jgi:nucleoside-triphosphatase THEP1